MSSSNRVATPTTAVETVAHVRDEDVARAREALLGRLRTVAEELLGGRAPKGDDPLALLDALIEEGRRADSAEVLWLTWVAFTTVFPRISEVEAFRRQVRLEPVVASRMWLMATALVQTRQAADLFKGLRLERRVVVDVHYPALHEHNSGIQRVVRRTMPFWVRDHDVVLAAWTDNLGALRSLTERETHRILEWESPRAGADSADETELVVPWRSRLILAEVPSKPSICDPLAALARFSGNAVSLIGYDAIPVVSAETVPTGMADHFAKYLTVVKWSGSVAAISAAAASEFRGFASMLGAQGLVGPRVVECSLPADGVRSVSVVEREVPLVVVVGSKEPRKNHVAVLFAAELLWREGVEFELFFVGTYGWDTRLFRRWLRRLQREGRRVSAPQRVGDDALWRAYAQARFTVFPSLHEGYGLPVAESLAYGTPVITTEYGSTGEIAAAGGCVVVDPRDDGQLVAAMRRLLTDDAELARLRAEAAARPGKTWEQYADEVWSVVGVSA